MKKTIPATIALLALLLLTAGCTGAPAASGASPAPAVSAQPSPTPSAAPQEPQELRTVRIGAVDDNGVLTDSARIAQLQGYFEEELEKAGYKPEYISFGWGGQPLNEAMIAGEIDVAMSDSMSQLILMGSGTDISAIAAINSRVQNGVAVQADSDIQSVTELEGKKAIIPTGSIQDLYFDQLAEGHGIDKDKVERINTVSDIVTVFTAKEADAVFYGLYTAYYMEGYGLGRTLENTYDHPEWTGQSLVAGRKDYWRENPEAAKALIRALIRAQAWAEETAKTDPDAVYAAISKDEFSTQVNARIYGCDTSFSYFQPELTEELEGKVETVIRYLTDNQIISADLAVSDYLDPSFYQEVMAEG